MQEKTQQEIETLTHEQVDKHFKINLKQLKEQISKSRIVLN